LLDWRERATLRYTWQRLESFVPEVNLATNQARLAAAVNGPFLIMGERGVGKEFLARTIHYQSARRSAPFAAIDCSLFSPATLERILFRSGDGLLAVQLGTLCLKEPHFLPRDLQKRLLALSPGDSGVPRLIATCSTDPAQELRAGRLLEDMYCLLGTLIIRLPPLRARLPDLPALVQHFLTLMSSANTATPAMPDASVWEALESHSWPGNLVELQSTLHQTMSRAPHGQIALEHLPTHLRRQRTSLPAANTSRKLPLDSLLKEVEGRLIRMALQKAHGNRSQAAEILGIWRARLIRRMEALGISESESHPADPSTEPPSAPAV
jgi:DNA-binding NtrC family response regulator